MADAKKIIKAIESQLEFHRITGTITSYSAIVLNDALELLKAYAKTEEEKQAERKQKRREWQAKYRESHRQQAYQTTKEWRKNNPEKVREQRKRYRERQKQLGH